MDCKKIIVLITLLLGTFIALMDTTIVNIAIPEILDYFSCSLSVVSWVTTGYNLSFAVLLITASRLADQFGRKKIFIFGIILFTITSLLAGMSQSIETLILFRAIQGASAACIVPVTMPIALDIVPKEKKGLIIGIWGAFSGLAAALGPLLGGGLTDKINWQSIFYINIPIGILTVMLAVIFMKETCDKTASKRIDFLGMITLSIALFCLTFAFAKAADKGWTSPYILNLFVISFIFIIGFLLIESKTSEPMVQLKLLKIRTFSFSSLTLFILGLGLTSGTLLITLLLTSLMEKSELEAGLIVSSLAFSSMITSIISGKFSDRYGGTWFSTVGMIGLMITTYLYGNVHFDSSVSEVIILLCATGLSLGLIMGPSMGSAIRQVPDEKVGIASGIINMMRSVGQALGIAILTTILSTNMTNNVEIAKKEAIQMVEKNTVFDDNAKKEIIHNIQTANGTSQPKNNELLKQIDKKEKEILANTPDAYKEKVKQSFQKQKEEAMIVKDKIAHLYKEYVNNSFSYTFKFASWLVALGVLFALFSDVNPRKQAIRNQKLHVH